MTIGASDFSVPAFDRPRALNHSKALASKLAKAAAAIGEVPKSGRNAEHNYDYATESDIVLAVRRQLFDAGVMLYPRVVKVERDSAGTSSGGNTKHRVTLHVTFTFVDGETGESVELPWVAEAQDTQDKGIAKALTGALKYFLRDTFLLATGDFEDETDADGKSTGRRVSVPKKERQQAKQAQALEKSPPRRVDPLEQAQREAFARLHSGLKDAGCAVPTNNGPAWNRYIGWVRGLAEQVLAGDVKRLTDLSAANIDKVRSGVVQMIVNNEVQPWKE